MGKAIVVLCLLAATASAEPVSYWLWAIDGHFEQSKSPCANDPKRVNPARQAIYAFIGSETFVVVEGEQMWLRRGKVDDRPAKMMLGPKDELIAFWYQGSRTWIVTLFPRASPAFATVTLVMEKNAKREGTPLCHERWKAPVSP